MVTPKKATVAKKAVKKAVAKKPPVKKLVDPSKSYTGPRDPHITSDVTSAVVDEIPPARHSSTERKMRYAKVLREIREQVGVGHPVKMAEFVGPIGATTVRRDLMTGKKPVDGRIGDWKFDARRLDSGGSVLYATLLVASE